MNNADIRAKEITKTSIVGIIVNVLLSAFKAAVGLMAGAIAVVLDAVNNLTDAISSVVTVVGIKLAGKKPNKKHPFGYGRIEYFSAIIIGAIILVAGGSSMVESIKKIITPEVPDYSAVTLIVVGSAIVVKIFLGLYFKKRGAKFNSEALKASGSDALFDSIISASTLISGGVAMLFGVSVDGIVGAIISIFILKAGIETLITSADNLIGNRVDSELSRGIVGTVEEIDGVMGAYDLIIHNYGPQAAIGSIHVEISSETSAEGIHRLTKIIQNAVLEKYSVFLTVGIYAVDEKYAAEREKIESIAKEHEGVMETHGIFVDEVNKVLSVDVVVDFTVKDRHALYMQLTEEFNAVFPDFKVVINFDTDYSD